MEKTTTIGPENPSAKLEWLFELLEFTEKLKLSIPFPESVEQRRAWYKRALAIFEAIKKAHPDDT